MSNNMDFIYTNNEQTGEKKTAFVDEAQDAGMFGHSLEKEVCNFEIPLKERYSWPNESTKEYYYQERNKVIGKMCKDPELHRRAAGREIECKTQWITPLAPPKKYEGKCCFEYCDKPYGKYGHNPAPYKIKGRCCDDCNSCLVIPRRMTLMKGIKTMPGYVGWLNKSNKELTEVAIHTKTLCKMHEKQIAALADYQHKYFARAKYQSELRNENRGLEAENKKLRIENARINKKMEKMMEEKMKEERAKYKKELADMKQKIEGLQRKVKKNRRK